MACGKWFWFFIFIGVSRYTRGYGAYSDQPKIVTEDGHMFIYSAENGNISLVTSGRGHVNINNENLEHIITLAQKAVTKLDKFDGIGNFQSSLNEIKDDITQQILSRIRRLELHFGTNQNGTFVPFMSRTAVRKIRLDIIRLKRRVNLLSASFEGFRNMIFKNECESNPCKNGATCVDAFQGVHCICPSNWEGTICDVDVDECDHFKGTDLGCQNGATCLNTKGSYSCVCPPNLYGLHCTKKMFDCSSSKEICGHGVCVNSYDRLICICDQGWTHSNISVLNQINTCTQDVDECASPSSPCSHDPPVPCINTQGSFQCGSCPQGYSGNGYRCADIDECQVDNGGCSTSPMVQCINIMGSRVCGPCPPGYSGDGTKCESVDNLCSANNGGCNSKAVCSFNPGLNHVMCTCIAGYVGSGIGPEGCIENNSTLDGCSSDPCQNGGRCLPSSSNSSYTCECTPLFTGKNCEKQHTSCSTNPCRNGGVCQLRSHFSLDNYFTYEYFWCRCSPGYSGVHCEIVENDCVGTFTAPNGTFKWTSTSLERFRNYTYKSCSWTFETDETESLMITFSKFSFPGSMPSCRFLTTMSFRMEIYDGRSRDSTLAATYCDKKTPEPFVSSQNAVRIDVEGLLLTEAEFSLEWKTVKRKCGGDIKFDTHGTIVSPGSPQPYPKNSNCTWQLSTVPGKRIQLTFFLLDIEHHENCSYDYLEIRDGPLDTSPLLRKFCSSATPAPIVTSYNHVFMRFHSDNAMEGKGFQISYMAVAGLPGCGGIITSPSGKISLELLFKEKNVYQDNLNCEWVIQLPKEETIYIEFKEFNIEDNKVCRFDSLRVFDGPNSNSKLVGRYCGRKIPPSFTSSTNYLTVIFTSDRSSNAGNFIIEYRAVCGGTFTEETGIIKSPYYPSHYPESRTCFYTILRPPKNYITLSFSDFDLEQSEDGECFFDTLSVYDGNSMDSPLKGTFCGQTTPDTIISTYNILFLKFTSDETHHGKGFYANYTSTALSCGGIYSEPNGIIEKGKKDLGRECSWVIAAPRNHIIQLSWAHFEIPKSFLCVLSYLVIYDNTTTPNPQNKIGERYCGERAPPPITSLSNTLLIVSHIGRRDDDLAFKAFYTSGNEDTSCVRNYISTVGTILSPKYPENYPKNSLCSWTITVENKKQIRLRIEEFDLEKSNRCHRDYLEIRNGGTKTSPLIGVYCGKEIDKEIISHSNQLFLSFKSDITLSGKGFKISWDGSSSGCGGEMTTSTGGIVSPNYPQPYGHNTVCYWKISTSTGNTLQLTMVDIDLETSLSCGSDYIEVFDGKDQTSKSFGRFCHVEHLRTITSTMNHLFIKFRSDISIQGRGFHLTYGTICNRTITGFHGSIESPNFPTSRGEPNNCLWIIKAPIGNKIRLAVSHFHMEMPTILNSFLNSKSLCNIGFLEISEGNELGPSKNLTNKRCRNDEIPLITSSTNYVYVHYKTTIYVGRTGFRLDWEVEGCGGYFKDKDYGEFSSPGYPSFYNNSVVCEWYFVVAYGKSIEFNVDDLHFEVANQCGLDSLQIYGGSDDQSPLLSKLCHPTHGETVIITTSGNMAFVRFESDHSFVSRGFHARFYTKDGGCGGSYTTSSGQIHSKNYPQNYDANDFCVYNIQVADSMSINLTFTVFDIDSNKNCTSAYVEVQDSSEETLGRFCGGVLPPVLISSGNSMTVILKSDGFRSAKGFLASYHAICGSKIKIEYPGTISFMWYNYQIDEVIQNCTWILTAAAGTKITLNFKSLSLKPFGDMKSAVIDIHAGDQKTDPLFKRITENKLPPMMVIPSSEALISFQYTYGSSFSLEYKDLDTACGGDINTEQGKIVSPNFPDNYPDNSECIWTINLSPGNKISLNFPFFKIDKTESCNEDFVEIREENRGGNLIGVYCGNKPPETLNMNTSIWILFRSSSDSSDKGFELDFIINHGGILTAKKGQVGNPRYPELPHMSPADYSWTIQVPSRSVISFKVLSLFLLYPTEDCEGGLPLYEGVNADAPLLKHLCDPNTPEFTSKTNSVFIRMRGQYPIKFLLEWEEVQKSSKPGVTTESLCREKIFISSKRNSTYNFTSPGFPSGYKANLNCEWIIETEQQNHILLNFDVINLHIRRFASGCTTDVIHVHNMNSLSSEKDKIVTVCRHNETNIPFTGGNMVKVTFVTDYASNGTGFSARASSVCGGSITDPYGVISVPKGIYMGCQWNITVKPGRKIRIKFTKFFFPGPTTSSCSKGGYVIVRNGGYPDSPFLGAGKFCGTETPSPLETSSNKAYIYFQQILTEEIEISYESFSQKCNEEIFLSKDGVTSVNISTPNYPNVPNPHIVCKWIVFTKSGTSIHFQPTNQFNLNYSPNCESEYIEVHEGSSEMGRLIGRYCTETPPSILSEGNSLFIKYYNDVSDPKDGFQATVSLSKCGGAYLDGYSHEVFSPNYPKLYEINLTCTWIFKGEMGSGYQISIPKINFGPVPFAAKNDTKKYEEKVDNLAIYQMNKGITNYYVGNIPATTFETEDNNIKIVFKSRQKQDSWVKNKSFLITVRRAYTGCGGTLESSEGEIISPGYPRSYQNKYCFWMITAPFGNRVTLTFSDLDLPSSTDIEQNVLSIYNNQVSKRTLIASFSGFKPNGTVVESTGSNMIITYYCFNCDTHRGFKAKYMTTRSMTCGGHIGGKNGSISFSTSSDFPSFHCVWKYMKTIQNTLSLTITGNFKLKNDGSYSCDSNDVTLKHSNSHSNLVVLCADATKSANFKVASANEDIVIESSGNYESNTHFNFTISWVLNDCGGRLQGEVLSIASPQFPKNYSPNTDCVWSINNEDMSQTKIHFNSFNLETDCENDYLEIKNSGPHLGKFCGTILPADLLAYSYDLEIYFHTNSKNEFSGFNLTLESNSQTCGGLEHGTQGYITWPQYGMYKNNIECEWQIVVPRGYHIGAKIINRFQIEKSDSCKNDFLEFFDYFNSTWTSLGKFCGREIPPPINSTSNRMMLRFRTNDKITGDGFEVDWNSNCGGIFEAKMEKQNILSPGHPGAYQGPFRCNYTVVSPKKYIQVHFNSFELEDEAHLECVYDYVQIIASKRGPFFYNSDKDKKYCGKKTPEDFIAWEKFTVIFNADVFNSFSGFDLEYRIYDCGGIATDDSTISVPSAQLYGMWSPINCTWTVTAPVGKIIVFSIKLLQLRVTKQCTREYIKIWDTGISENKTIIGTFCGNLNTKVDKFRTKSNQASVDFSSLYFSKSTKFEIHVKFTYGEASGCGGTREITTGIEKIDFSTKNFNELETFECSWTVKAPVGSSILFDIKKFNMTHEDYCSGSLLVSDGYEYEDEIFFECSLTEDYQRVTTGHILTLNFVSYTDFKNISFSAEFKAQKSLCGITTINVTQTPQSITSPNYPQNYPTNVNCVWNLYSDNRKIYIHIDDLDMPAEDEKWCFYDRLYIENLANVETNRYSLKNDETFFIGFDRYLNENEHEFLKNHSKTLDHTLFLLCGKSWINNLYFNSKLVQIKFISDYTNTSRGFKLTFTSKSCTRNYTSDFGRIQEENINKCRIFIFAKENRTISLYFRSQNLPYGDNCNRGHLKVFEGSGADKLLFKTCSYKKPGAVFSSSSTVMIDMFSDNNYGSIDLTYTSTDQGSGCGGNLTGGLGAFTSPFYPDNYRKEMRCEWYIMGRVELHPVLEFEVFDLGPQETCTTDYIEVYDIGEDSKTLKSTFCGQDKPAKIVGEQEIMLIVYKTSLHNGGSGFSARFELTAHIPNFPYKTVFHSKYPL